MTVMYFVRHGQSEGNVRGGFAGRVDYALSEKGERQARRTADFLRDVHLDAVCASPLRRAQATASAWQTALHGRRRNLPRLRGSMPGATSVS